MLNAVHGEVYIGFHELESLIPTPACDGPGAPASPASSASLASPDSAPTHPKPMDSPTTALRQPFEVHGLLLSVEPRGGL